MMQSIGPFCEALQVTPTDLQDIDNTDFEKIQNQQVVNGHVLELFDYGKKSKQPLKTIALWLQTIFSQQFKDCSFKTIENKISRTVAAEKKEKKKKNSSGFYTKPFIINSQAIAHVPMIEAQHAPVPHENSVIETQNALVPSEKSMIETQDAPVPSEKSVIETQHAPVPCEKSVIETQHAPAPSEKSVIETHAPVPGGNFVTETHHAPIPTEKSQSVNFEIEDEKNVNMLKYEISKKQKELKHLQKLVGSERETLNQLKSRKGHFSVRNVTKRDEAAATNRKILRETRKSNSKLNKKVDLLEKKNSELNELLSESDSLKISVEASENETKKKVKAQKLNSYYRTTLRKVRNRKTIVDMEEALKRKEKEIDNVLIENEILRDNIENNRIKTRDDDGHFNIEMRLCVLSLFSLEIGVAKISEAIKAVSKHLFKCNLEKSDLPSESTTQNIVDEGQYLTKVMIADKIDSCSHFGVSRDGTSRKKQHILDTSVTLDSGEVISLGFTKVARETAKTINEVTKSHINELAETCENSDPASDEDFTKRSLQKLSFTMSDRASNEKLANKLLADWRNETLKSDTESEIDDVLSFHCMAHVLLGFHRYICTDMKTVEKDLIAKQGPIGRDALPMFKFWSRRETIVERVAKTTSDIFGPVGDHLGVRDAWEAHCAANGIRSVIGNYKDNRFNGLFQTAAEILHHRDEFLKVLSSVPNNNKKIQAVKADLQSECVEQMLGALCVMYVQITGPYWWLVTESSIPYLCLAPVIKNLENVLKTSQENPEKLLDLTDKDTKWFESENIEIPHEEKFMKVVKNIKPTDFLKDTLKTMAAAMLRTVQKQLHDFITGQFSEAPTTQALKKTEFAHKTNLGCEHHFGDLDSSQRRRPNASFHHHTSVQLLKRNREHLFEWIEQLKEGEQSQLMKTARAGGRAMRKRHREEEENVSKNIYEHAFAPQNKKRRRVNNDMVDDEEVGDYSTVNQIDKELPSASDTFVVNEYLIVAYQDNWYPGVVVEVISDTKAIVNFMLPCKKPGTFQWPNRKDIQEVEKQFVLKKGIIPNCMNNGRQWHFNEYENINRLYEMYKKEYF